MAWPKLPPASTTYLFRRGLPAIDGTRPKAANNSGRNVSGTRPNADYTVRALVCLISDSAIVELIS